MKRGCFLSLIVLFGTILLLPPAGFAAENTLRIATGSRLGTYHHIAEDIAKIVQPHGVSVEVIDSLGSLENVDMLKRGTADLAIVQSDVIGVLHKVDPEIVENIRVVFPLYLEEVHLLAKKGIHSLYDLSRKKVATGIERSGNAITMSVVLYKTIVPGVKKIEDMGPKDAVTALLTGDIDAMVYVAGKPVDLFKRLETMKGDPKYSAMVEKLHFLPIESDKLLQEYYTKTTLTPADYQWMDQPVPTIAVRALLVKRQTGEIDAADEKKKGCDQRLVKLVDTVRREFDTLKKTGHPKWEKVDLDAPLTSPWEYAPCVDCGVDAKTIKSMFD